MRPARNRNTSNNGRGHLAVVRGGRDDGASFDRWDRDPDWQAFCRRIGWQAPTEEPRGNLEERLAARIFGDPGTSGIMRKIDFDIEPLRPNELGKVVTADFGAARAADPPKVVASLDVKKIDGKRIDGKKARASVVAMLAIAAVAVVAAAAAALAVSRDHTVAQPSAERDAIDPTTMPADAAKASEDAAKKAEGPSDRESPTPSAVEPSENGPKPPGAALAIRSSARQPRANVERAEAVSGDLAQAATAPADTSRTVAMVGRSPEADAFDAPGAASSSTTSRAHASDRSSYTPATGNAALLAANVDTAHAGNGGPLLASWSISPSDDRWVGMSASAPPLGSASGLGVTAQVDLSKAFRRL